MWPQNQLIKRAAQKALILISMLGLMMVPGKAPLAINSVPANFSARISGRRPPRHEPRPVRIRNSWSTRHEQHT